MQNQTKIMTFIILVIAFCQDIYSQQSLDAYIFNADSNKFVVVANAANSLSSPVDIDFYPDQNKRTFELWILNQGTVSTGGSTVIVSNANKSTRTFKYVKDGNSWHFMSMASALAFGDSLWATSADILDANHSTGRYTGPTLWPSDLSIYGVVGNPSSSQYNGSHLDMVHQSPYSKGIAFEKDLVYWVLDGYEGNLKRYDYVATHEAGGSDHSAASVQVYNEFNFTKHSTLPSHIIIDQERKYLYGCDPVGKRVFRVDITTGSYQGPLNKINNEPLAAYDEFTGLDIKDIITTGLTSPVGIDIYGDRLIVTDNATKEIILYNIIDNYSEVGRIKLSYTANPNIMGVKVGPDGQIYFADKLNKKVMMIENDKVMVLGANETLKSIINLNAYPNPSKHEWSINGNSSNEVLSVNLYNAFGELIKIPIVLQNSRSFAININNQDLRQGIYFLKLSTATNSQSIRLIKE
ncbi:MAG: T9SS type A sorting domain-containing protein [Saprospiraceae bacterium]